MKDSYGTYDGTRPEPPYDTADEMQRMGQEVIDQLVAERDALVAALTRIRDEHSTFDAIFKEAREALEPQQSQTEGAS